MNVLKEVEKIEDYIIDMRRYFHQNAELSWKEFKTSDKIAEELEQMNIPYTRVCGTGIIGTIKGNREKPIIGIRADIDALPIKEETGLEFKSLDEDVMHACGHDSHMAMLLGAAKVLNENKDKLNCTVKLIFQPAEEFINDSGAKHLVLLDEIREIDNIVGAHIWPFIETGKISVEAGPRLSSADTFEITVKGKGGHGGIPDQSIDPIVVSASLVNNLQSLVSREIPSKEECVISICSINSGNSSNVIPEKSVLKGTTRTFNNDIRDSLEEKIERIVSNTCKVFRAEYEFVYEEGTPPTINEEKSSKIAEKSVVKALGEGALIKYDPSMVGEDFAKLLQIIPGCLALVGTRNEEEGKIYPNHNPKFDIDEPAMKYGSAFFIEYVMNMQDNI